MRILVVEDNPKLSGFLIKGLREESYAVDLAETGPDALDLVESESYDLLILDILLPLLSGLDVVKRLRSDGVQTPVLMLTARGSVANRVEGLDAGADDYLPKPFAFDELLARTRALLRRGSETGDSVLRLGDLTLELTSRVVCRAGEVLELTPKEYALLEYLLRNQGHVLTRTSIIEHVWGIHYSTDTNIVDVLIRYLRRKLDDAHEQKLIHTVRGVGYVYTLPPATGETETDAD